MDQYVWSDGFPVLYTDWAKNPIMNDTAARCVVADTARDGGWTSSDCQLTYPFVCKFTSSKIESELFKYSCDQLSEKYVTVWYYEYMIFNEYIGETCSIINGITDAFELN